MGESGSEWSTQLRSWAREADKEEPVGNRPKSTTNSPNHPSLTIICAAFTSLVAVADKFQARNLTFSRRTTGEANEYRDREPAARRGRILGSWSWTPRSVYWRLALYKVGGGISWTTHRPQRIKRGIEITTPQAQKRSCTKLIKGNRSEAISTGTGFKHVSR